MSDDTKPILPKKLKQSTSRSLQNQVKRQREWIYLVHYLAIQGLDPVHIISGQDDGYEPDFTLVFWEHDQLVYIGIELTTLPRLRTQMSDKSLITKRWYWQSLLIVAKQHLTGKVQNANKGDIFTSDRFRLPMKTSYMPEQQFIAQTQQKTLSYITQDDVDAVIEKKKEKINAYNTRRRLDEIWLLIHTDKYQPNSILTAYTQTPPAPIVSPESNKTGMVSVLQHDSAFDRVHITRYPSYKAIEVKKA